MGEFVTAEAARERFHALADQVDAAYHEMRALSSDHVGNAFRTEFAERLETQEHTNRGLMYRVFGEMADPPDEAGMAPVLVNNLVVFDDHTECPPDHGLATSGHYKTIVTDTGRLAWTDGTTPPEINHAHHPEELLRGNIDPPNN